MASRNNPSIGTKPSKNQHDGYQLVSELVDPAIHAKIPIDKASYHRYRHLSSSEIRSDIRSYPSRYDEIQSLEDPLDFDFEMRQSLEGRLDVVEVQLNHLPFILDQIKKMLSWFAESKGESRKSTSNGKGKSMVVTAINDEVHLSPYNFCNHHGRSGSNVSGVNGKFLKGVNSSQYSKFHSGAQLVRSKFQSKLASQTSSSIASTIALNGYPPKHEFMSLTLITISDPVHEIEVEEVHPSLSNPDSSHSLISFFPSITSSKFDRNDVNLEVKGRKMSSDCNVYDEILDRKLQPRDVYEMIWALRYLEDNGCFDDYFGYFVEIAHPIERFITHRNEDCIQELLLNSFIDELQEEFKVYVLENAPKTCLKQ